MSDISVAGMTADEVHAKVEAILRELTRDQGDPMIRALQNDIALRSYHAEGLVNEAAQCFPARSSLPPSMNRFPLKYLGFLHRLILRFYELLFREQRGVNLALIKALREAMAINRQLNEQILAGHQKHASALREVHALVVAHQSAIHKQLQEHQQEHQQSLSELRTDAASKK